MSEDDDDGDLVKQQDEEQEEQGQHSDDDVHAAVERRRRRQQWWAAQRPPAWRFRPEFQALAGPAPARLHPYAQLLPLQGHQGHTSHDIISALEFSPNGQLLASGSLSKQVCAVLFLRGDAPTGSRRAWQPQFALMRAHP